MQTLHVCMFSEIHNEGNKEHWKTPKTVWDMKYCNGMGRLTEVVINSRTIREASWFCSSNIDLQLFIYYFKYLVLVNEI